MNNLESDEFKVNSWIKEIFGESITGFRPTISVKTEPNSCTIFESNGDAFALNDVISGGIKHYPIDISKVVPLKESQGIICRIYVGFSLFKEMANSSGKTMYVFSNLLNNAIGQMYDTVGDISDREIFLVRPGIDKRIFFERNGHAAYELRLTILPKINNP